MINICSAMLVTTLQSLCSFPCLLNQIDLCVQFELESGRSVRVHVEYWGLSVSLQVTGADHGYTRYSCSTETYPWHQIFSFTSVPRIQRFFVRINILLGRLISPTKKELYINEKSIFLENTPEKKCLKLACLDRPWLLTLSCNYSRFI